MARTPGYGELLGRLDDLEGDVKSLRQALMVVIILGAVLWMDLRGGKEPGHVD